jgi:hypothetical protein
MLEDKAVSKNPESGQVTLMHLFLGIAFCMPITAAATELKNSGGGTLRYLVAVPSALALGAVIVWLDAEARENSVVEMSAVLQAGAKCGWQGFICGRVAPDCCWGHLGIQAGSICRRACRTVTLCTPNPDHWQEKISITLKTPQ